MGWLGGAQPLGEADAAPQSEPPPGVRYSSLAMAPMLRPASHRPRRPVVVDGAVWE
jgi:hypothetical protein